MAFPLHEMGALESLSGDMGLCLFKDQSGFYWRDKMLEMGLNRGKPVGSNCDRQLRQKGKRDGHLG